ncbi:hypothetical protein CFC21_094922 [Triticum aestivum]|nr:protein DMP6-like [Aegilops tauschii subsp. strangulata]KAF7092434.1 hypothetical protein CFC21_094918 [Triticum aestivum]KAF7092438.1 hypothetical protein CFC21_094922 [Triticum aestivum]
MRGAPAETDLPVGEGGEPPKPTRRGGSSSLYDKTLSTASNLARLLPTGTTTAFQTLAPSFTNHGECLSVNRYFTWALILFLGVLCALLSFTDSVTDRHGHTRYGFVHPWGFTPFNSDDPDGGGAIPIGESRRRRMRWRDWLHSVFRFIVFISLAFCDSGVQKCLVPRESRQWREFLVNMPLASGFLASFVFMIFPSTRHGIGAGPAAAALDNLTDTNANANDNAAVKKSKSAPAAADTRVAPSTSYQLGHVV